MRGKSRLWAFVLVLLASGPIAAADGTSSGTTPDEDATAVADLSPAGLEAIQTMMDDAVADGRVPAAVSTLARDGEIVWLATAGEMAPGIPMRQDAILPLASVGKMFTAVAAMILVERGVIALDDPVKKYIPEFANVVIETTDPSGEVRRLPPDRPITVYHLLTHTGGLTITGDAFWDVWNANAGKTTTTHMARDLAALPLTAQPGERFEYGQTGASYEVLAAVIEIASRKTLEDFLNDNLFEPMGMADTSFYVPEEQVPRLPAVYRRVDDKLTLDREHGEDFPRSTFFHGGGGVRSSAQDLVRFTRLFLEGGSVDGVRILGPESVDLMMRDQVGDKAPERWRRLERGWGFGAAVKYSMQPDGSKTIDKYGWVGGGFAKLWIDPAKRLVAYFNVPLTPPGDYGLLDEFERLVEAATP